jgi:recombination protein RecT
MSEIIKVIEAKLQKDKNTGKITSNVDALRDGMNTSWFKDQIVVALGSYIQNLRPEKMSALALGMVQSNDLLRICEPISVFGSILQVANLGLSLDGFRGEAYLVPFWNNKKSRYEAKPMVGYRGLHKKLIDSGSVRKAEAAIVREKDHFEYERGDNEKLVHKPNIMNSKSPIIGAWACIWLNNGSKQFDFMTLDELLEIRDRSKSAFDKDGNLTGPWKTDMNEMMKKTVLRRLAKWASVSPDATKAAMLEEYADNTNTSFKMIDDSIDYSPEREEEKIEIPQPKAIEPDQVIVNDTVAEENRIQEKSQLKISKPQQDRLFTILNKLEKRTNEEMHEKIFPILGIEHTEDMLRKDYDQVINWVRGQEFVR